ncbi:MAG: DUF3990 domain-containing protein [Peptostreptococcaceae bacterium]|nr:DUF3990 domain-containing protein [Peptostreptococcaceae bacterium]
MKQDLVIYHGSDHIIKKPIFGAGKSYNDYGKGFYCTQDLELAKEWACMREIDGYANGYTLHIADLNIMCLTRGNFNILNWLAILLANRKFDIFSPIGNNARDFILSRFLPDIGDVDILIGYRADDSYFSFAEDFVNNTISLRDLSKAMQLGTLGEQVVLISERAFERIEFTGYEIAGGHEYYPKRVERDKNARADYANQKKNLQQLMDDLFILDIMREDMKNDDPRLRSAILGESIPHHR